MLRLLWLPGGVALLSFCTACTSLLGIAGDYVAETEGTHTSAILDSGMSDAGIVLDAGSIPPPPRDSGVQCALGHYEGTFEGQSSLSVGVTMTGTMAFDLGPGSANGLELRNGTFSGAVLGAGLAEFKATPTGTLDCAKQAMTGKLVQGRAQLLAIGPIATPPVSFSGTMKANFDAQSNAFVSGSWTEQHQGGSGQGTWTAQRVGP